MKKTRFLTIALAGLVTALFLGGCSSEDDKDTGVKWTAKEVEASKHYFNSQRDNREAARLARTAGNQFSPEQAAKVLQSTESALAEARMVTDDFLDKSHPKLKAHFREEFIPAVEMAIKNLHSRDFETAKKAGDLFSDFSDWVTANQKDIRFPRE